MTASRQAELLQFHHSSTVVDDVDDAVAFLRESFGFEVVFEARGMTDLIESMLGIPGLGCDLVQGRTAVSDHVLEFIAFRNVPTDSDPRLPVRRGQGHLAYVVRDLHEAIETSKRNGGRQIGEVTEFAEGPAAYLWMPAGGVIEIEQHHVEV